MSETHFHFSVDQPFAEALAEMPASVNTFLQKGFDVLTRIPSATRTALIDLSLRALHSPQEPGREESVKFGVDLSDLRAAIGAVTFAIISLGNARLTPQQFVAGVEAAGLLTEAQKAEVSQLIDLLGREQPKIKQNLDVISSGKAVLPAFYRIDWSVDLRARYDRDENRHLTPVGIMFIATDKRDHDLFVQVTMPQLDYLLEELNKMRRRILDLEDWKNARTSG